MTASVPASAAVNTSRQEVRTRSHFVGLLSFSVGLVVIIGRIFTLGSAKRLASFGHLFKNGTHDRDQAI
ncbi:MAG: hypothetical protein AAFY31_08820 [Pseudomonadota bacterium]